MRHLLRTLALTLALCLLSPAVLAESTEAPASAEGGAESRTVTENAAQSGDVAFATVNGEALMQSAVDGNAYLLLYSLYTSGYDITDAAITAFVHQQAMQIGVEDLVVNQKAAELGLDQLTAEEEAELSAQAQAELDSLVESWIASNVTLAEDAGEGEQTQARLQALAALEEQGYTLEAQLAYDREVYISEKVYAQAVQGVAVTDAEVQAAFDAQVESDRTTYADAGLYEMAMYYYGMTPYCVPEGYRGVSHILLQVDSALMDQYVALQASLEEAQDMAELAAEATADPAATAEASPDASAEPTAAPVTQADVDAAYAAIIASVQPTIDEIHAKLDQGVPFADLVAEYGTDPGMNAEPTRSLGYSVHMDSIRYDPAFVQASFSVDQIGDVSEPYVGSYGVYIVCYLRDVPAGPIEMTEEIRTELYEGLLQTKEEEAFYAALDAWVAASEVTYTAEGEAYLAVSGETAE